MRVVSEIPYSIAVSIFLDAILITSRNIWLGSQIDDASELRISARFHATRGILSS